jgi:ribosomal protein S18 acetylase RimI-like enzyme
MLRAWQISKRMAVANMFIREVQEADLPSVHGLLRQLGYDVRKTEIRQRIDAVVSAPDHHAFVAVLDNSVIGLAHVYERAALEKPLEAVVQSLIVDRQHRGNGVGKMLMQAAESWAENRGVASVVLHTRVDREDARQFYAKLNYETLATSNLMRKRLKGF